MQKNGNTLEKTGEGYPSPERKILGRKTEKAAYGVTMPHYIKVGNNLLSPWWW